MTMKVITADQVHAALSYPDFIDTLGEAFAGHHTMPPRQVMLLDEASGSHDAFAMLPSWNDEVIALKAFTYSPGNQPPNHTLYSQILVFDRKCGEPLALVDGVSVTCWLTSWFAPPGRKKFWCRGEWIRPGTHTDFLGNHHATRRECDTAMVTRSRVSADSRVNCFNEAGEILIPLGMG